MDPSKNLFTNLGVGNNRPQQNYNNMNDSMGNLNISGQPYNNSYANINRFSNNK